MKPLLQGRTEYLHSEKAADSLTVSVSLGQLSSCILSCCHRWIHGCFVFEAALPAVTRYIYLSFLQRLLEAVLAPLPTLPTTSPPPPLPGASLSHELDPSPRVTGSRTTYWLKVCKVLVFPDHFPTKKVKVSCFKQAQVKGERLLLCSNSTPEKSRTSPSHHLSRRLKQGSRV